MFLLTFSAQMVMRSFERKLSLDEECGPLNFTVSSRKIRLMVSNIAGLEEYLSGALYPRAHFSSITVTGRLFAVQRKLSKLTVRQTNTYSLLYEQISRILLKSRNTYIQSQISILNCRIKGANVSRHCAKTCHIMLISFPNSC